MGIKYQAVANFDEFIADVRAEYARAMKLFPDNGSKQPQLAVFAEEAGEVPKALLDHSRGEDTIDGIYTECVQAAAMAARLAIEGSIEFPLYVPPTTRD